MFAIGFFDPVNNALFSGSKAGKISTICKQRKEEGDFQDQKTGQIPTICKQRKGEGDFQDKKPVKYRKYAKGKVPPGCLSADQIFHAPRSPALALCR